MEQKFKRGNLVRVLQGHMLWTNENGKVTWHDISPETVGKQAIVEYSYKERYGGNDVDSYSIMWMDTGHTLAWKHTNELELIDEGGEHLFVEAQAKAFIESSLNTDLQHIVNTWEGKKGKLSSETILFLFDKIGYKSSFHSNGEFYVLQRDWFYLYELFNLIMLGRPGMSHNLYSIIPDIINKEKVTEFYNEVKTLQP